MKQHPMGVEPAASSRSESPGLPSWQEQAVVAYQHHQAQFVAALPMAIAATIEALTGRTVPPEQIVVDPRRVTATVVVDGVIFHWREHHLAILCPCEQCGTGQFVSPPVSSVVDLGAVLSAWQPRCGNCHQEDPADELW